MNKAKQKNLKSYILNPKSLIKRIKFRTWISLGVLAIFVPLTVIYMFSAKQVEAGWFDESFAYRQRFSFTHNADISDTRAITFSLDTAELISGGVMQADCDDTRFTDINGKPLLFDLTGTCDDAATTYEVVFEKVIDGTNVGYVYYGNSSVQNAEIDSTGETALTPSGGDPAITDRSAEAKGPGPIAYWKLDEAINDSCTGGSNDLCDSNPTGNDAAFESLPVWQKDNMCVDSKCLYFDGVNDSALVANTVYSVQTISLWVKVMSVSTTEQIFDLNGTDYITSVNGTLTVNGFGTNTVYIDGKAGTTITPSYWHYVVVTTTTGFDGTAIKMAKVGSNYGNIFLDNVKLYNYARSQEQIKTEFLNGSASRGSTAVVGERDDLYLSQGLTDYLNFDGGSIALHTCPMLGGSSADVCDWSGNSNHGLDSGTMTNGDFVGGKFHTGLDFDGDGAADDAITVASAASIDNVWSGGGTVSAWVYPRSDGEGNTGRIFDKTYWYLATTNESGGSVKIEFGKTFSGGAVTWETSSEVAPLNTWSLVTVSYDSDNIDNVPSIYINGQLVSTTSATPSGTSTSDSSETLYIGNNSAASSTIDGIIDEVRVYNLPFDPKNAFNLYNWAPGPSAYFNFDEGSGTVAHDRSGNGLTGNMTAMDNTNWTTGKLGRGLSFDGVEEEMVFSNTLSYQAPDQYHHTLSAWIKTTDTQNGVFFTRSGSSAQMRVAANSLLRGQVIPSTTPTDPNVQSNSTTAINNGSWHFVAQTWDRGRLKIYVDGVMEDTDTSPSETSVSLIGDYHIGSYIFGTCPANCLMLKNTMDEVRMYNYARTPDQIIEDMNAGNHPIGGSINTSPVGYWGFDNLSGSTAYNKNSTFQSLTGNITEAAWTPEANCKLGGCLSFDGSNDVVTVANATPIDFDIAMHFAFTFSAWINPDTVGEGTGGRFFEKNGTYCELGGSDPFNITCVVNEGTDATLTINSAIPAGTWTHVALSWSDDDDDKLTIWINGRKRGISTDGVGPLDSDSSNLLIGGGTSNNFDGYIDEFKLYSGELSAEQVKIDMNANSAVNIGAGTNERSELQGGAGNPAVGYWPLDENTGTSTTYDKSGNSQDGTLTSITGSAWVPGKYGSALQLDGSADYVDVGTGPGSVKSVSFWTKPATTTEYFVNLTSTTDYIAANSGTLTPSGFTSPSVYINGVYEGATGTIVAGKWQHVVVTTDTAENASNFDIGRTADTNYLEGEIDEIKLFDYALDSSQVEYEYNRGKPFAYWKFDDCESATAHDTGSYSQYSNGYNATIYPVSLGNTTVGTCGSGTGTEMWNDGTSGKRNASLGFDGSDDYAEVADDPTLRFDSSLEDFSVFAWVKRAGTGEANIISKEDADDDGWRLQFTSGDILRCSVDAIDIDSNSTITDTNWHFVGCSIDRSGNGQVYIDGFADGTATAISSEAMDNTSNIAIGTRSYTSANYFNGLIDDLRIYRYPLTLTQIRKAMNNDSSVFFGPSEGNP